MSTNFDLKLIAAEITAITSVHDLNQHRAKYFGSKGLISQGYAALKNLTGAEKATFGKELNHYKTSIEQLFRDHKQLLESQLLAAQLAQEQLDISLPPKLNYQGGIHPTTQTAASFIRILSSYGFELVTGPSLETNYNNFDALNIGPLHPARQMHDTFYLDDANLDVHVLRTHTSSVQIRAMQQRTPPFRLMSLGRVYRDDSDQTHTPMFHQLEGIMVAEDVTMANLKYLIEQLMQQFFEVDDVPLRLRPSYFPFTEPSVEIDINYRDHNGSIKIGKGDKWLEVLGCGMINPKVLANVGIDSNRYQGFAFGVGIDRMAMLKYGIANLPSFFAGDWSWLQFNNFNYEDYPL